MRFRNCFKILFTNTTRVVALIIGCIALACFIPGITQNGLAQQNLKSGESDASAKTSAPPTKKETAPADNEYSKKIREYTTEPYFLTELVDHLPLSDKVPSPDKVLGYIVGTPNKLTYSKDLYRYYRELAKATPRVRVFTASERSEEGKEQLLIAVGDEAALAKLDRYKEITAKLSDPRKINDSE